MDAVAFDRLSRTVAAALSRRRLTRLLGGLPLAAVGSLLAETTTAATRQRGAHPHAGQQETKKHKKKKRKTGTPPLPVSPPSPPPPPAGCTPRTSCPAGLTCSSVPDGCGGTISC